MLRSLRAVPAEPPAPTRRARLHAERRLRARRRTTATLAAVALVASALPSAAAAGGSGPDDAISGTAAVAEHGGVVAPEGGSTPPLPDRGGVRPFATVEDADAWCSYLSSYYLAFPSPWSARVINCRYSDLFVAPVHSDGSLGMCVLVPARHSRHLGGNVARWVTDIRLC